MALLASGTEDLVGGEGWTLAAVATAAAGLSLLRRRLPATVLVLTSGLAPFLPGFLALLILVGWSAGRYVAGVERALAAFTTAYVLNVASTAVEAWQQQRLLTLAFFSTLYFLATTLAPGLAHRYWTQRRTLLHALQERNVQLLRERAMLVGQARMRERQRIAQDMHDSLGHQLALISVHTGALEVDPHLTDRQREVVAVLRGASMDAMHELREVVGILRDGVEAPDDGDRGGQGAALTRPGDETGRAARGTAGIEGLVTAARAAGTAIGLNRRGETRALAPAVDHAAYRIVQEGLTNAYKHAPGAPITVEVRYEPDAFVVEVLDEEPAEVPSGVVSGGQGLPGLHERARLVGGIVHAGPADGGGFRVAGVLPYGAVEAAPYVDPYAAPRTDPYGAPYGEQRGPHAVPQVAPFVDAADDFRQQWKRPRRGDRGRVAVGPSDWTVAERELAMAMQAGRGRSTGGGIAIGCGIAVAALVLLLVAAGFGLWFLMGSVSKGMVDPGQYDAVKVGDSERKVRDSLPSGDTIATAGLHGKGPAEPEGSSCLVLMSSETSDDFDKEPVFRFCFKDGKLIEKKSYEVVR
ncbi:histidine kinase [Streptomyces roseicoloratus]|uniref:histidine kinase n=1 Tax=Streptomyces roseicoloratus TaxID=2508722 RepID=A0ABY9S374_9ACTN|nr:histidine kinase [Streptomyces roseicoloratus]WMX48907.1 histidine kinase [Streptomyces roseicoloratus]